MSERAPRVPLCVLGCGYLVCRVMYSLVQEAMRVADANRFQTLPAQLDQQQQAALNLIVEHSRLQRQKLLDKQLKEAT